MKKILLTLVTLISFILPQECEEPENVWFKISNNKDHHYGQLLTIDMAYGYALYDEVYIYLFVLEKNTGEELVIMFPIGYWEVGKIDKIIPEQEKKKEEFDLDEYLKKNKGKGRMINANIIKVGD
jgi:hypothetical protein